MIINLPKLGPVRFRDDMTQEELNAQIGRLSKQYGFTIPKPDIGLAEIAKRGLMRGVGELGIATGDVLPAMVGSKLGFNKYARGQMEEAAATRAALEQQYPTRFKSYQDVGGVGEGAEFVAETLGELAPNVVGAMLPGLGAGAVATRYAGQRALMAGLSGAAAKESVQKAGKKAMYGGVYFGSAAQNMPEVFENIYRETNRFEPGLAALAGGFSAILDSIVPGQVLDQLGAFGRQKAIAEMAKKSGAAPRVWKTLSATAAKTAATEGLTESAQEAISATAENIAGSTKDIFDPENIQRYKEAFVKGAIGGAAFGTVGGAGQQIGIGQERKQRLEDIRSTRTARDILNQEEAMQGVPTSEQQAAADMFTRQREEARARRERELNKIFAKLTPFEQREADLSQAFRDVPDLQSKLQQVDGLRQAQQGLSHRSPTFQDLQHQINVLESQIQARYGRNGQVPNRNIIEPTQEAIAQQQVDNRFGPIFDQALDLQNKMAQLQQLHQLQALEDEGSPRFNAYQENIDALGNLIQQQYGRNRVIPRPSLKITPQVIKTLGLTERNTFAKFINGMDLQNVETVEKLIRTIENPLVTDPSFEGDTKVESAYNKLIAAIPQDVVSKVREKLQTTTPPPIIPLPTRSPSGIQQFDDDVQQEPVQEALRTTDAIAQRTVPQQPEAIPEEIALPQMTSLNDLSNIDPNNPIDVAEVLRFGETMDDQRVQQQLKLWVRLNVPEDVMGQALEMTAEPDTIPTDISTAQEIAPQEVMPQESIATEQPIAPPSVEPTAEAQPVTDPISDLLVEGRKMANRQERDAHAYFDTYDPKLALMSIAHDVVNQPTAYGQQSQFAGQGGVHAKNAEAWVRKNLSKEDVAEFETYLAEAKRQQKASDEITTVVPKTPGKSKPKKEAEIEEDVTAEEPHRLTIDEVIDRAFRDFDASKKGTNFKADADNIALRKQAHNEVHAALKMNDIGRALSRLATTTSEPVLKHIARKLISNMDGVKVTYGAKESSFDPTTNTISLRKDPTEYEVLHEATHAAVSHIIANKNHRVTRQLQRLFEQARTNLDPVYGTKDLQEFVAEAWSNNDFRDQLDSMRDTSTPAVRNNMSIWDRIIDTIRHVLGLGPRKKASVLDQVDRLVDEIISPPPVTREGVPLYAQSINDPKIVEKIHSSIDNVLKSAPLMNEDRATTFWANLEKLTTKGKALAYRTLNLSALGQVSKKVFGGTGIEFSDKVNSMSGYQENLQERAYPLHRRLQIFAKQPRYQEWSTLVHDSTKVDVDPSAPKAKYIGSEEKVREWTELNKRYNKMTPDMQKLYKDLFAAYKTLNNETLASLENNILSSIPDKEIAKSTYKKLLTELSKVNIDHYAPLYRRGVYRLDYTAKDGDRVQEFYTTQAERTLARKKAAGKGAKDFDEYSVSDTLSLNNIPDGTVLSNLVKIMKDEGMSNEGVEKVANLIAKAMPETSMWKHRMRRQGISGYIDDAALAFDNVTSSAFHQLSRVKYSGDLNRLLSDMAEKANTLRGPDQERARLLLEEFKDRHKFAINPNISAAAQLASTGSFFYFLAGNVSSAVVNILQLPLIVGPQLGGEYGYRNATRALNKAMQMYTSGGFRRKINDISGNEVEQRAMWSLENAVNSGSAPQYKGLLDKLKEFGFLQTSTARDATISAGQASSAYGGVNRLHYLTNLAGTFMFHHAERANREITAIAAYDLAKSKLVNNKNLSKEEIEAQAIDRAIRAVETMHGAGHTVTGPSLGHSDLGKVLMVFKRFAFSMYYMLFDTMRRALPIKGATGDQLEGIKAARRQLAGIYGMSFLFAGVKGMPLYWIGELAYNAFVDDDEDDFDTVMRKFLGDMPYKGPVNYYLNLSIADRVGWSDLIFREGKTDKSDASTMSSYIEGIFGAPYAIANNMFRAKELIADGHYERAVETALPIALRNLLKGPRFATEGVNTLRGDPIMGEVSGYNAMMQTLGFAPADLSIQYMNNAYAQKKEAKLFKTRDRLARQYYLAYSQGDIERAEDIRTKLFEFGDKHPELGIDEKYLEKSVATRDRITSELYHGVQLSRRMKESLLEDIEQFK